MSTQRCAICGEPIELAADWWPSHRHGDRSCGTGDGAVATASNLLVMLRATLDAQSDLLHAAWGIIANSGVLGDPSEPTPGCTEAAERWRDRWFGARALLDGIAGQP